MAARPNRLLQGLFSEWLLPNRARASRAVRGHASNPELPEAIYRSLNRGRQVLGPDVGSGEGDAVETRDAGVDSVVDMGPRPAVGCGILSASLQDQKQIEL